MLTLRTTNLKKYVYEKNLNRIFNCEYVHTQMTLETIDLSITLPLVENKFFQIQVDIDIVTRARASAME